MMQPNSTRADLRNDILLVAMLIGLDVAARLLPHVPGVMPVAASGLFAARMLQRPALAVLVPILAMGLSAVALPPDDWRVSLVVYGALAVPALAGLAIRAYRGTVPVVATMVGSSLAFFALSNFAVWAFGTLYPRTLEGLAACYAAALPFLDKTLVGDLAWTGVLFGGAWLAQHGRTLSRRPI